MRKWLQRTAAGPLDGPGNQYRRQIGSRSAQERSGGENHDAGEQKTLAAEAQRHPTAGRQNNGIGYEIAGQDPGSFIRGGRKTAGDMRQRNTGYGSIDYFHKSGQHHRKGDQPGVYRWKVLRHCQVV